LSIFHNVHAASANDKAPFGNDNVAFCVVDERIWEANPGSEMGEASKKNNNPSLFKANGLFYVVDTCDKDCRNPGKQ
jgi:hypothetical protein